MKKVALIVLLAVIASRVLSDRSEHSRPNSRDTSILAAIFGDEPPAPPQVTTAPRPPEPAPPPVKGPRSKRRSQTTSAKGLESALASTSKVAPPWFPKSDWEEEGLAQSDAAGVRVLVGQLSASEDRAKLDLRKTLNHEIADWLAADIPMTWTPPQKLVNRMTMGTYVQAVTRDFGPKPGELTAEGSAPGTEAAAGLDDLYNIPLYRAGQKLDFSSARRAQFVESYHRDVASSRMRRSGSVIAVVLACLAMVSLYVRADEATKGYYTNRLRVLATAGLGIAGGVAYHYWA